MPPVVQHAKEIIPLKTNNANSRCSKQLQAYYRTNLTKLVLSHI